MSIKILTIDDSKTIRLIVTKALRSFDCTVLEGSNGVEGLAVATREKPDLILLDYTMPVMDGLEVLARLRSDPDLKTTPVIMLTAEAGRETVVKIAKLGVRDYIIKPFKEELLTERVGRVVTLKARTAEVQKARRFDDPISVLVVDDKPTIVEQIRAGLSDTPWVISSADQSGQATDICMKKPVDVVLASLSLPKDGAYLLLQNLRAYANTASVPVFALCVKTETSEQSRAQHAGFASIVTKPIDCDDLKSKISRALRLETSYKYFQLRDRALVLTVPNALGKGVIHEISTRLKDQLIATVDAGAGKLVVDISQLDKSDLIVIELIMSTIQASAELSLKHVIVASDKFKKDCATYEETQSWAFVSNMEMAMAQ